MEKQVYILAWNQPGVTRSPKQAFVDKERADAHCKYNNELLHLTRIQKMLGRYWVVKSLLLIR
jgi:hypothetical protein